MTCKFSKTDLKRIQEWFNLVEDMTTDYLVDADYDVMNRIIHEINEKLSIGARVKYQSGSDYVYGIITQKGKKDIWFVQYDGELHSKATYEHSLTVVKNEE